MNRTTKLRMLFLAFAIIWTGLTFAQNTYKTALLYDVHGPVRSLKYDQENPIRILLGTVDFAENGRPSLDFMTYDSEGYPLGFGVKSEDGFSGAYIEYDHGLEVRPNTIYFWNVPESAKDSKTSGVFEIKYSSGTVNSLNFRQDGENNAKLLLYSDHVFDSHGNWVERKVVETEYIDGVPNTTHEYRETRKITYFDN